MRRSILGSLIGICIAGSAVAAPENETPFTISENDIPRLLQEKKLALVSLYHFYAAQAREKPAQKRIIIKRALSLLEPQAVRSKPPLRAALYAMCLTYSASLHTGETRIRRLSKGILILERLLAANPDSLRLRYVRLMVFSRLPRRYFRREAVLARDRKQLQALLDMGSGQVRKELGILYNRDWDQIIRKKVP